MKIIKYCVRGLLAIGSGLAIVRACEWVVSMFGMRLGCGCVITMILVCAILVFFVQGFCIEGFLLRRACLELRGIGMSIGVFKGDLFAQEGVIVIPVNDFFDTLVDDIHIAKGSLHGLAIQKYWPANILDLDAKIATELSNVPFETVERDGVAKTKRYPVGTSVFLKDEKGRKMIFTALTRTDAATHVTSARIEDLVSAVRGALGVARKKASGAPISFPLMGSGNARIKLPHQALFETILSTIIAECNDMKVSPCINVVLRGGLADKINFANFKELWEL